MKSDNSLQANSSYYVVGGTLDASAPSYVSRTADKRLLESLKNGEYCYVLTTRQMGKSSLMIRTAEKLKEFNIRSAIIDLTAIGTKIKEEAWYLGQIRRIVKQLCQKFDYLRWWKEHDNLSEVDRYVTFLSEVLLEMVTEPIVLFIDEIDSTLHLPFSDDFFAAIRSLYNERATEPKLRRLSIVLLGVASPSELIKDVNRTPFNIGQRIELDDFTLEESSPLASELAPNASLARELLKQIIAWTGGHPYLTQRICSLIADWVGNSWDSSRVETIVDTLVRETFLTEQGQNTDDNIQLVRDRLIKVPDSVELLKIYELVRQGHVVISDERNVFHAALKLSGIVKTNKTQSLQVRNQIYYQIFDIYWISKFLTRSTTLSNPNAANVANDADTIGDEYNFAYDVFISYSSKDSVWVRNELLPQLDAYGLRVCIDFRDFQPGAPLLAEMERAILTSRRLLLVLTPSYLASDWTKFESLIIQTLDPEREIRQLIPVLKEACDTPLRLRSLVYLDFVNPSNWQATWNQLLESIAVPLAQNRLAEIPTEFIPAPAPLPIGSRMPLSPNPLFVGREEELRELAHVLKVGNTAVVGQIAAVTGLGGIGKTQLAVEFVHRYGQFFAGGVFWLSFANPAAVPAEVAACGGRDGMRLHVEFDQLLLDKQVQLVLAEWLKPIPRLLVIDNCDDEALLEQWRPRYGGCRVLVTSRRTQWDMVLELSTIRLRVLPRSQSIALLQAFRPDLPEDDANLAAIAAELGDLPLALYLAGSYLKRYQQDMTTAEYLDELHAAIAIAHESLEGSGGSPTQHDLGVARTFQLSYDRLDERVPNDSLALVILTHAAYFAPGELIPRDLLHTTLNLRYVQRKAKRQITQAVRRLVGLGLLEEESTGALCLHRLLAIFIRTVSNDSDAQGAVEQAMVDIVNDMNIQGSPRSLLGIQPHLRVITDTARQRQDVRAAELCAALGAYAYMIGNNTQAQHYYQEAVAIYEHVLTSRPASTSIGVTDVDAAHGIAVACCRREEGITAYYTGSHDLARRLLTDAWQTLDRHGQSRDASRCLIWLATLENFLQSSQQAQAYLDAARAYLAGTDDPLEQAACDFVAGMIEARQTRYKQALTYFAAAEQTCSELGAAVRLGRVYIEQAYTLFALQRFTAATSAARKARVLFQEHGMPQREAFANDLLAQIATATNQFVAAQQLYERAQVAYEAAGMPVHSAQALIHRANIDYYLGAWGVAEARYREALMRAQQSGARIPIFVAHSNLGLIAWESGRLDEGLTLTQLALADALSLQRLDDAAHCHLQLAGIYSVLKQDTNATTEYQAALSMLSQLDKPVSYAEAQLNFAEFCLQAGDGAQARVLVEAARRTYAAADMPVIIAHCDLLLAKICLTQRRLDEAAMLVEQCIAHYTAHQLPISLAQAQMVQGAIAAARGESTLAQQLYQRAVTVLDKLLPIDAADGAIALAELAEAQHDDALALTWRCNAVRWLQQARSRVLTEQFAPALTERWLQQARSRVPTEQFTPALTERYAALLQTTLQHAIRRGEFALALMLAEDARTQVALSWVEGRRRSEPLDPATLTIAERCADLRRQIEGIQQEQGAAIALTADRAGRLAELQERYDEALALWRRFGSQVLPGTTQPFDWPSWLAQLTTQPYRWQVLAYWYTDDQIVIWHATPDTLTCIQRPLQGYDRAAIDLCTRPDHTRRAYVYDRPTDEILHGTSGSPMLKQVAALVLPEHLADTLTPDTLLIIVPDGPLHTLPFAALPLQDNLLVNLCTPMIAPSLDLFRRLDARPRTTATKTLALGVTQHQQHEPLPYAGEEVQMVATTLATTDVWCDAQATVTRLQASNAEGLLRQYRQIHFATHAWPDLIYSMQAGIALFDGNLELADLAHLDLDADLVVLSACESGVGESYAGGEVVSLTFALLQAGTRALVRSLWPVIDEATLELMRVFYTARREQILGPWSLVAAQRQMLERGFTPYTWAGFTWHGAPNC